MHCNASRRICNARCIAMHLNFHSNENLNVQCTLQSTLLCNVHCAGYAMHRTQCILQCIVRNAHCRVCIAEAAMHCTGYCIVFIASCHQHVTRHVTNASCHERAFLQRQGLELRVWGLGFGDTRLGRRSTSRTHNTV